MRRYGSTGRGIYGRWPRAAGFGVVAVALAAWPLTASAATIISESFTGAAVTNTHWVTGGTVGGAPMTILPCLTASTNVAQTPVHGCPTGQPAIPAGGDTPGSGALRLTDQTALESAVAVDHEARAFNANLTVDFDFYMYDKPSANTSGGDGLTFFIANGATSITTPGGDGGALGYTRNGGTAGVAGAYLGVGFDEVGNFEQTASDGTGCPSRTAPAVIPQVGLRGPGSGTAGYCFLATSGALPSPIDNVAATTRAPALRHAHIVISSPSASGATVTVSVNFGSGLQQLVSAPLPSGAPATYQLGFTSADGALTAIHEVANLVVSSPGPPQLTLTKSHSGSFAGGGTGTFTLTPGVSAAGGPEQNTVTVSDTLPSGLTLSAAPTGSGWTCSGAAGATTFSCTRPASFASPIAAGTALPAITVPVNVSGSASGSLTNTATISAPDATSVSASDTVAFTPSTPPTGAGTSLLGLGLATLGLLIAAAGVAHRRRIIRA
ncbi:MAG: hypothetical protein JOZ46_01770 [Candidatus Dormibacteraeota bacterium]|nr:hypothetical protein [Candidatus Dormibacteraeota bacterium]MBV9524524.1 hypothetical protein [Candidatus Dormibacteraeota bacterium]